jgi:tRNA(fMet)-specific endonuclease VapC
VYLLDTDHINILQRRTGPEFLRLQSRLDAREPSEFFVPIVSFHEQVAGWSAYLNRARTAEAIVRGYEMFQRILSDFTEMSVAPFDDAAASVFTFLRKGRIRIGTIDLRIAAIAVCNNWNLLSRNLVDFQLVPNLRVEDWSQ